MNFASQNTKRLNPGQRENLVRALAVFNPAVIYVFGSHGTSARHPGSDLDIGFLPVAPVDPIQVFETANFLSSELGTEVDLVDLSTASTVFRKEVIRTGEAVHIGDVKATREFEMSTLSDYARLNEERREVLAAL